MNCIQFASHFFFSWEEQHGAMVREFVSTPRTAHEKQQLSKRGIAPGTTAAKISLRKIRNVHHAKNSRARQRDLVKELLHVVQTERAMHAQTLNRLRNVQAEKEQLQQENNDLKLLSLEVAGVGATLEVCDAAAECRLQYPFN